MIPLVGAVQHYAWGSHTAIPAALGMDPDGHPWAEVWWGTHPGAVTLAAVPDRDLVPLSEVAAPLPYLVKLLAAAQPLSLQAHPTLAQAAEGFARENGAGVPLDSPLRNYRDPYSKPEILVAVTPFAGRCGFRPVDEAAQELRSCGGAEVASHLLAEGPAPTMAWLLRERPQLSIVHPFVDGLGVDYPGDPGAVVALLLNHVSLSPGEAILLPAGVLHMYLHGVGLEGMGASDNVVRGGLTPKHVDVDELLRILDPAPRSPEVLRPDAKGWYPAATDVFAVQALGPPNAWTAEGPEIVVRIAGGGQTEAWFAPDGDAVEWPGGL